MNVKKTVKKKARGVTMKARIAALDRAALVQRLQDVGEHQKAALFHRSTSDEINRLHGALHMPGLSAPRKLPSKTADVRSWTPWIRLRKQWTLAIWRPSSAKDGSTTRRLSHHLPGQSCRHKGKDA
ncbi:MAG UNVERIFIED_CONTAM: hypothetical protein LVR18_42575 [Planctomycetaceae bacterium]|jgi:hypothetical protein